MTSAEAEYLWRKGQENRERLEKARRALGIAMHTVLTAVSAQSRPARAHIRDHAYTWAGFAFISGASFLHSPFTGLLVTGILALIFEWKVGE